MELGLSGRRSIVTGAGRGIGRAIAMSLAKEDARVAVVSRTRGDLDAVVDRMGGEQAGHCSVSADLTARGAPGKLVEELTENGFAPVDIVVHNLGGTLGITDPFCSVDDWRRVYRLNFEIAVELNLLLVPRMQAQKWGRVVHISSISSMENHGPITYCAMKAALTAYTRSFGGVVAPDGVVVSTVLPGAVLTKGGYWDETTRNNPEHVRKYLLERQRIGRLGRPEEIGNYVAYLCSELASFNTGSIVPIDGGQGRGYFGQ